MFTECLLRVWLCCKHFTPIAGKLQLYEKDILLFHFPDEDSENNYLLRSYFGVSGGSGIWIQEVCTLDH